MTRAKLNNAYFDWMYNIVCNDRSYYKLLRYLHCIDFQYSIAMDGNRADDGVNLRYRFGYERSYDQALIATYLDDRPCSVLEMLIALAIRCEENIMYDPDLGDRTGVWFGNMINNLNLESMHNADFDREYVDDVIDIFLNRKYKSNGEGGLFTVNDAPRDLRDVEIWYQLCWYLNENM